MVELLVCTVLPVTPIMSNDGRAHAATSGGFTYTIEDSVYGYGAYITDGADKNPAASAALGGQPVVSVTFV